MSVQATGGNFAAKPVPWFVVEEALRKIRVFAELDPTRLSRVAAHARLQCVAAGETVVTEQQPAENLRGVVEGRLSITLERPGRNEFTVSSVSAGDILGWETLSSQKYWLTRARALKNTTLVVIPGTKLLALCEEDHELGYHVMHRMFEVTSARLHDMSLRLLDSFGQ